MNVPKTWIQILCLVSLMVGGTYADVDAKEHFCGKKLVKTLAELCSIYNSPSFGQRRFRRQIVEECCRSQCSRRYLVEYYCFQANSSVLHELELENTTERRRPQQQRRQQSEVDTHNYQADSGSNFLDGDDRNSLTVGTNNNQKRQNGSANKPSTTLKALTLHPGLTGSLPASSHNDNKITRRKRNCKCRKRREKRIKKSHPSNLRKLLENRPVAPPANIGTIGNSQNPFYVWKFAAI